MLACDAARGLRLASAGRRAVGGGDEAGGGGSTGEEDMAELEEMWGEVMFDCETNGEM